MIRLRCPGGRYLALVMLAAVLLMVVPAAPVGAQVLEASWLLPVGGLPAAEDLLLRAGRITCDPRAPWRNTMTMFRAWPAKHWRGSPQGV